MINCPHCDHPDSVLTGFRYNNGSSQNRFFRCPECDTEWFTDRQNRFAEITKMGATRKEKRRSINEFAIHHWAATFMGPFPFPDKFPFVLTD